MRSNDSLSGIPITTETPKASMRLHWQRRALQFFTIVLAILIPVTGLFRIDPIAGAFVVADRQVWWSDFFLVFGFWLVIASGLVLLYSTVGTAFCGWSCPQNSMSEWANYLTQKLLGKRAEVSLTGEKMKVGVNKNKWSNWSILGISFIAAAMFFALIPLLYFYSPAVIWSFITFQQDERLADSLHIIYFVFVAVIFLDIAFIRHFWCRFMCIYKVWQHGFKTQHTLHIEYDHLRSELCDKCNFCVTHCFLDLDPRRTDIYDSCINCGECITACNNLQAKKGLAGLLSFNIGDRNTTRFELLRTRLSSLSSRVHWTMPFALLGITMFIWGLISYERYHLAVYRADTIQGSQISDYRIAVSNKLYDPATLDITVDGLDSAMYELDRLQVKFSGVGRIDMQLHIKEGLPPGIHPFRVQAKSPDGWKDSYRVQHFVAKK
ncbi:4Fe-4S binding protein [Kaarinaea lacus]